MVRDGHAIGRPLTQQLLCVCGRDDTAGDRERLKA
jgi:hypothetical protein